MTVGCYVTFCTTSFCRHYSYKIILNSRCINVIVVQWYMCSLIYNITYIIKSLLTVLLFCTCIQNILLCLAKLLLKSLTRLNLLEQPQYRMLFNISKQLACPIYILVEVACYCSILSLKLSPNKTFKSK